MALSTLNICVISVRLKNGRVFDSKWVVFILHLTECFGRILIRNFFSINFRFCISGRAQGYDVLGRFIQDGYFRLKKHLLQVYFIYVFKLRVYSSYRLTYLSSVTLRLPSFLIQAINPERVFDAFSGFLLCGKQMVHISLCMVCCVLTEFVDMAIAPFVYTYPFICVSMHEWVSCLSLYSILVLPITATFKWKKGLVQKHK